jgi:hypothetical protein
MRTILTLLACLAVAPVAAGCSRSGEYCDTLCQCESCSDTEYDECVIQYESTEDTADAYGCTDDFDIAHECVMVNNDCVADNFAPELECLDDIADVNDCINDNSSVR